MTDSEHRRRPDWLAPPLLIATCGWVGRIPFAPGTFGSLVGLPLSLATGAAATWLAGRPAASAVPIPAVAIEAAILAVFFLAAIPICTRAASLLASKDPGPVVIDEAVAVPVVLLAVPPAARGLVILAAAFVLFRLFDILKPPPVRQLERLPRGLGIMADDIGAAALAAGCLAVARWQGWL
ncbi:MAG: phosphatidylglycerophosphatase A [Planctomycetota bacterium]|nr:phosphatidylglycerophosphatase A [Planctomycetota bacterium]